MVIVYKEELEGNMEAHKIRLLEFLGSSKRTFNIPVYQRNYEWKIEHCKRLFEDIESIIQDNYEYDHFLGTIVYVSGHSQPNFMEFIIIDGQQRITSIMILIKALYDLIEDVETKEDILETYLINKRVKETNRIKLKPIKSDMAAYERLMSQNESIGNSNITKNYNQFKDMIKNSKHNPDEIYKALSNVEIVYISLDKDKRSENPQLIFESLNSTGLTLLASDLIRNYLLMNHSYDSQCRLYSDYWLKIEQNIPNSMISDFIRDFLTMKTGSIPNKDKIYEAFKNFCKKSKTHDEEGILEELVPYSQYYSWFQKCNSPHNNINKSLSQILNMKSTVTYPVLLYLFEDCFLYKKIDINELNKIMSIIISYLFRRSICELPANALNKIFASLVGEFEKADGNYYDLICQFLLTRAGKGVFPRDEQFKVSFVKRDIYNTKVAKYALSFIEENQSKEVVNLSDDNIQIEHIMPQVLSPAWKIDLGNKYDVIHNEYLHTIGNLTLTGYNNDLSNSRFDEKKETYRGSNILITRTLAEYNFWNDESIKSRALKLFEIAKTIWYFPEEYNSLTVTELIDFNNDYNIMDDVNVKGLKPRQVIIIDCPYSISSWKDLFRTVIEQLYELDNEKFQSFADSKDFEGRERRIIAHTKDSMREPYQLTDSLFIETNLNANTILNYCKIISEKYALQDDIYYNLRT